MNNIKETSLKVFLKKNWNSSQILRFMSHENLLIFFVF